MALEFHELLDFLMNLSWSVYEHFTKAVLISLNNNTSIFIYFSACMLTNFYIITNIFDRYTAHCR